MSLLSSNRALLYSIRWATCSLISSTTKLVSIRYDGFFFFLHPSPFSSRHVNSTPLRISFTIPHPHLYLIRWDLLLSSSLLSSGHPSYLSYRDPPRTICIGWDAWCIFPNTSNLLATILLVWAAPHPLVKNKGKKENLRDLLIVNLTTNFSASEVVNLKNVFVFFPNAGPRLAKFLSRASTSKQLENHCFNTQYHPSAGL